MALDLGSHGIRVNSVSPGDTATEPVTRQIAEMGAGAARSEIESKHALRRIGQPDEVARVVVSAGRQLSITVSMVITSVA